MQKEEDIDKKEIFVKLKLFVIKSQENNFTNKLQMEIAPQEFLICLENI